MNPRTIMLDTGSSSIKSSYVDNEIIQKIPTVTGKLKFQSGETSKTRYVGHAALSKRGILTLQNPFHQGKIQNFEEMEALWNESLHQLIQHNTQSISKIESTEPADLRLSEHCDRIALTEPPLADRYERGKIAEIWFEKFSSPELTFFPEPFDPLFAIGRASGTVVHCGLWSWSITIFEGCLLNASGRYSSRGGDTITTQMELLLRQRGYGLAVDRKIAHSVKEKDCYIARNFEKELLDTQCGMLETNFELPDGQVITYLQEKFAAPESLFAAKGEGLPLQTMLQQTIQAHDPFLMERGICPIICEGGTTHLPGFSGRMSREAGIATGHKRVVTRGGANVEFRGLRTLLNTGRDRGRFIDRQAYEEFGPNYLRHQWISFC